MEGGGSVSATFLRRRGRPSRTIFARVDRPVKLLTTLSLTVLTQKNCSRLSSSEAHFLTENGHFAFLSRRLEQGQRMLFMLGSLERA